MHGWPELILDTLKRGVGKPCSFDETIDDFLRSCGCGVLKCVSLPSPSSQYTLTQGPGGRRTESSQRSDVTRQGQGRLESRECHIPSMRAILSPFALVHPLPINYQPILPTC